LATYACETWSTTKSDESKLLPFERKVFRKIYGPTRSASDYEKGKNADLEQLYNKPNIKNMFYAKRLEWAGHMRRADGKLIKNVVIRNLSGKTTTWKVPTAVGRQGKTRHKSG